MTVSPNQIIIIIIIIIIIMLYQQYTTVSSFLSKTSGPSIDTSIKLYKCSGVNPWRSN